jgi:thiamine biosynthesis protein ThiS
LPIAALHIATLQIIVNGQPRDVPDRSTVADLLRTMQFNLRQVAVEVNLAVVPRARHAETALAPGDRVEIVTLVGGG